MKVFLLFQTDVWKTKSSRVCFGVFDSSEEAYNHAAKNSLYDGETAEIDVIETELNKFEEV